MKAVSTIVTVLLFAATAVMIAGDQCSGPYEPASGLTVFLWTEGGGKFAAGVTDDKGRITFKIDKERMDLLPDSGVLYVTFSPRPEMSNISDQRHRVGYIRTGKGNFNFTLLLCNVPLNSMHPETTAENRGSFAVSGKSST
jgi:hypothetical protein